VPHAPRWRCKLILAQGGTGPSHFPHWGVAPLANVGANLFAMGWLAWLGLAALRAAIANEFAPTKIAIGVEVGADGSWAVNEISACTKLKFSLSMPIRCMADAVSAAVDHKN